MTENLDPLIQKLEQLLAEYREVIKDTEWIDGDYMTYCPYCNGEYPNHKPDCKIKAILDDSKEAKAPGPTGFYGREPDPVYPDKVSVWTGKAWRELGDNK